MQSDLVMPGLRCTNHKADMKRLASGVFDLYNPCSWCVNRSRIGRSGPAFHYIHSGQWEFPYIAETSCKNFSLLKMPGTTILDEQTWDKASAIHRSRNVIAQLGQQYGSQWLAFAEGSGVSLSGQPLRGKQIYYPNSMSATTFFREVSEARALLFELSQDLRALTGSLRQQYNIRDSQLEQWLKAQGKAMSLLTRQIDELESNRDNLGFAVVSKHAVKTVAGNVVWESFKWIGKIFLEVLSKGSVAFPT